MAIRRIACSKVSFGKENDMQASSTAASFRERHLRYGNRSRSGERRAAADGLSVGDVGGSGGMTETVRVVLAGCGNISRSWLNAAREIEGLELVGLVDLDEAAARRRATEYG